MAYKNEIQRITSELHYPGRTSIISAITSCLENTDQGNHELAVKWASVVEDWTWERLHSGHWEDVPLHFRELYSMAILLKVDGLKKCGQLKEALRTADKGILLGAPILNNRLQKMADEIVKELKSVCSADKSDKRKNPEESDPCLKKIKCDSVTCDSVSCGDKCIKCDSPQLVASYKNPNSCQTDQTVQEGTFNKRYSPIDRIHCPSLDVFFTDYMKPAKPVVLTGCMKHWPSMGKNRWSLNYVKDIAGLRTVPVELGSRYTDDGWSQQLMTVNEFIDRFIESKSKIKGYLAQHTLFQQIPRLHDDICIPDYCCLTINNVEDGISEDVKINAWFGPKGTISPLHFDPQHNLLSQVVGSKYIVLFDKADTPLLYPHEGTLSNTSQVDIDCPDYTDFPLFKQANGVSCLLDEGEMLYIPPQWWHYVRSCSLSFSVSFWWS